jgi:predicted enzyme related to lactoylglutathione lyase
MTARLSSVIYPVKDLSGARSLYATLLGVEPSMDEPYYVGFQTEGLELGLDPNGHANGMTGPVGYWKVDDIHSAIDGLVAQGARVEADVAEVGGGRVIARLVDADGNPFGMLQDSAAAES